MQQLKSKASFRSLNTNPYQQYPPLGNGILKAYPLELSIVFYMHSSNYLGI